MLPLPVGPQSAPPFVRVLNVGGFLWVIGETVGGELGRAVFVTGAGAFLGVMGVYWDGSRVRILQVAGDEIVSCRMRPADACELFSLGERISAVQGHRSVLVEISPRPTVPR